MVTGSDRQGNQADRRHTMTDATRILAARAWLAAQQAEADDDGEA
jgi:hypothetical protein